MSNNKSNYNYDIYYTTSFVTIFCETLQTPSTDTFENVTKPVWCAN